MLSFQLVLRHPKFLQEKTEKRTFFIKLLPSFGTSTPQHGNSSPWLTVPWGFPLNFIPSNNREITLVLSQLLLLWGHNCKMQSYCLLFHFCWRQTDKSSEEHLVLGIGLLESFVNHNGPLWPTGSLQQDILPRPIGIWIPAKSHAEHIKEFKHITEKTKRWLHPRRERSTSMEGICCFRDSLMWEAATEKALNGTENQKDPN